MGICDSESTFPDPAVATVQIDQGLRFAGKPDLLDLTQENAVRAKSVLAGLSAQQSRLGIDQVRRMLCIYAPGPGLKTDIAQAAVGKGLGDLHVAGGQDIDAEPIDIRHRRVHGYRFVHAHQQTGRVERQRRDSGCGHALGNPFHHQGDYVNGRCHPAHGVAEIC